MLILVTLAAIAATFFWNRIAGFLVNSFLPFIKEHAYPIFDVMTTVVDFINKGVVLVRQTIANGYNWIKRNLLRCATTYELDENGNVHSTTVTVIQDNGRLRGFETKEVIDKWNMPPEAFAHLSRNASQQVDCKQEILNKTEQMASKQQLSLADAQ